MITFKENLKSMRKREQLTQKELADKTGLTRSRINNYERGVREPDLKTLELLAEFFEVDFNTLISGGCT